MDFVECQTLPGGQRRRSLGLCAVAAASVVRLFGGAMERAGTAFARNQRAVCRRSGARSRARATAESALARYEPLADGGRRRRPAIAGARARDRTSGGNR